MDAYSTSHLRQWMMEEEDGMDAYSTSHLRRWMMEEEDDDNLFLYDDDEAEVATYNYLVESENSRRRRRSDAPPKVSMLARAASSASAASRAARAAAAVHRAAAAVSRAARSSTDATATAAADLALGTSSREARSLRRDASRGAAPFRLSLGSDSTHSDSCLSPDDKPKTPKFVADEKDLESDEALWALYERWCKHFNQERDRDEMARRFDEFKRVALHVHQENNSDGSPNKLAINQFADGKLSEVCLGGNTDAFHCQKLARLAKVPITGSTFIWLDGKCYMEVPEEFQPE